MEKGRKALSFSLEGSSRLERIHIPTLGANKSAHWAVNTPHIWGNQTLHEVNILKKPLLNIILSQPSITCVIHRHRFTIIPHYEQGNSAAATVGKTL